MRLKSLEADLEGEVLTIRSHAASENWRTKFTGKMRECDDAR